jgi:hypothetical protein
MERRTFIAAIAGGLLAPPLAAEAQQAREVARIRVLHARCLGPRDVNLR